MVQSLQFGIIRVGSPYDCRVVWIETEDAKLRSLLDRVLFVKKKTIDQPVEGLETKESADTTSTCGVVMPISGTSNCSEAHWKDVLAIIQDAVKAAGFEGILVSEATDVGVIQKRIVQNLYDNPVVVCDVSERNPNVMFELGMRLAFDKPIVIIKDDETNYSFDTSPVEHLTYPRDLRFGKIVEFKEKLAEKVKNAASSTADHSFLSSFGSFKVAEINVETAPVDQFLLEEMQSIKSSLRRLERDSLIGPSSLRNRTRSNSSRGPRVLDTTESSILICVREVSEIPEEIVRSINHESKVEAVTIQHLRDGHIHIEIEHSAEDPERLAQLIQRRLRLALP